MPSPVAHSFIGLSIGLGWVLPRCPTWREIGRSLWNVRLPLLAALFFANAPDLDYVPGVLTGEINAFHHYYTHTLVWAFLVALGAWMVYRAYRERRVRAPFLFLLILVLSHLGADLLTNDQRAPYGIMALWPASDAYYISPTPIFPSAMKADWGEVFQMHNVKVMLTETLMTAPLVLLVLLYKRWAPSKAASSEGGGAT